MYKMSDKTGVWKFSTTTILAVDECSMVSIELFYLLLKCLNEGSQLQKIVMMGEL